MAVELTEYPPLFGPKGQFIGDQWPAELLDSLPAELRPLFDEVKEAAAADSAVSADIVRLTAVIRDDMAEVGKWEDATKQKRPTFMDVWRANVQRRQ